MLHECDQERAGCVGQARPRLVQRSTELMQDVEILLLAVAADETGVSGHWNGVHGVFAREGGVVEVNKPRPSSLGRFCLDISGHCVEAGNRLFVQQPVSPNKRLDLRDKL